MPVVVVNDASCLIDLRKGRLLQALCRLPFRFVVPLTVRESELLDFSPSEWAIEQVIGRRLHHRVWKSLLEPSAHLHSALTPGDATGRLPAGAMHYNAMHYPTRAN